MTSETIIGIDLGTTNSEVAVVEHGKVTVIQDQHSSVVPSVVGLDDNNQLLIGEAAKNQYLLYPERTIRSIKRRMGEEVSLPLGEQSYSPAEISAMILRHLKGLAESYLGETISKAVITVPAYFSDAQRQATREAGEIAGLEVVRIINEPTAAALAYEPQQSRSRVLVYDLGGGTFDVSVVNMEQDVVEVLSSHGNNHLGGDDFDQAVVDYLLEYLKDEHDLEISADRKAMARINRAAENAKIALSDQPYITIAEEYLTEKEGQPFHLSLEFSRHKFNELINDYIVETLDATHTALKDAGLTVSDIDKILLVGGSTKSPVIRERLYSEFGLEAHGEINPDLCVATGAAVQAGLIGHADISTILVDITPYSYGTSCLGELDGQLSNDLYIPIIRKNSALPINKSEVFYTNVDNQETILVDVYQGESRHASENDLIGEFHVHGLQKVPSGNPIIINFDLDLNGILNVTAKEKSSGLSKSITIENALAKADATQLSASKERLNAFFASEDGDSGQSSDNATATESMSATPSPQSPTDELIAQAAALLESVSEDDQEDINSLIKAINSAKEDGDNEAVTRYSEELQDIIYYLQS
ncbi:heat-shock protein Hsp70 [Ectothiorhodospiraceae bacterium BW-2]|nr:heat-shock protein Hsp70 [Ectothiorhodospiraceae bacterium BW-2]